MSRGRIILLGASGQLGRSLTQELAERGNPYELVSYTHEQLDYTDTESVARAIKLWEEQAIAHDWTMIVNCAAFTQVAVSYTHLTLPTKLEWCRSRWSPYH